MEIATIILLIFTFVLIPMPIKIDGKLFLTDKYVELSVRLWNIRSLKFDVTLCGAKICLRGTLNIDIDLLNTKFKDGIDFSKCLSLRNFFIASNSNLYEVQNMKILNSVNVINSIVVPIICRFTHARVGAINQVTREKSNVAVQVLLTTTLLECAYSLIKQSFAIKRRSI